MNKLFKVRDLYLLNSRFPLIRNGKIIGVVGRVRSSSFEELERLRREAERFRAGLLKAEKRIRSEYQATYTFDDILGKSDRVRQQKELAKRMARSHSDILISGESGTGKELFAHAIHNESEQRSFPFIKVNCQAIPVEIAESELFGYEKGAFTGARQEGKPGKFELAEGGTIFLDEIGALPVSVQAKILRVIQEREVERLGGKKAVKLNFRLIAATNIDLKQLAEEGKFRLDLIFRLSKAVLTLSPLRERKEDIPVYVAHFVKILNKTTFEGPIKSVSEDVMKVFDQYDWPGNVRELANSLEQSFYNMAYEEVLRPEHLPNEFEKSVPLEPPQPVVEETLKAFVDGLEKDRIVKALEYCKGNKKKAAEHLGIQRSVLYSKMRRLKMT
jgi:transcriptional regulator with PAS, ATPase and Fis domain